MSDKLDITGTWKQKKNFLGSHSGFIKDNLFLFIPPLLPGRSSSPLLLLKEDWRITALDTLEKGTNPNQTVWTFNFGKTDYKLEYFREKKEIKISKNFKEKLRR